MRITQGSFSFLPDLSDAEIAAQIDYALKNGWAVSVEHTGVKSAGCENSTPQLLPRYSWKRMGPAEDSCSKSGAVSPRRS